MTGLGESASERPISSSRCKFPPMIASKLRRQNQISLIIGKSHCRSADLLIELNCERVSWSKLICYSLVRYWVELTRLLVASRSFWMQVHIECAMLIRSVNFFLPWGSSVNSQFSKVFTKIAVISSRFLLVGYPPVFATISSCTTVAGLRADTCSSY